MPEAQSKQITRIASEQGLTREQVLQDVGSGKTKLTPTIRPVLVPQTFDQLVIFANMAAASGMVPKEYVDKPGAIMVAIQMGSELGLAPMQALQNIACINGRPAVWGDALPGLCRQSGQCKDIQEWIEGTGNDMIAYCKATRVGCEPITQSFSVTDAKRAGLWKEDPKTTKTGKNGTYQVDSGPWYSYPKRMLQMRARGFALRDAFPDVLRGLISAEEARDIPVDSFRGTTIEARSERAAPASHSDLNDEIPERVTHAPKKQSAREWLTDLRATLASCHTEDEVHTIAQTDQVKLALSPSGLKNGALAELNAILAEALERVRADDGSSAEEPESDFPGDRLHA